MAPPLNSMHRYFTGRRLLTGPWGNEGPYGPPPPNNGGSSSGRRQQPFIESELSVLGALAEVSAEVSAQVSVDVRFGGKRKCRFEGNKSWKPEWSVDFPWAEPQFNEHGEVVSVNCYVCSEIRERPMLIKNKRDNLLKHSGSRRAKSRFTLGDQVIQVGQLYNTPDCVHWRNDRKFRARGLARRNQVPPPAPVTSAEMGKKYMQFAIILDLLRRGRPLADYPKLYDLFDFLKFEMPKKHWNPNSAWGIADSLRFVVDNKLREEVERSEYFSVSADEVTSIANDVWISLHIYVVKNYKREGFLLTCKRVAEDCNAVNIARIVTECLLTEAGLKRHEIGEKMISFGADGAAVFQGFKGGVTKRMQDSVAPFLVGHHCVAHRVQLAAQKLGSVPFVERVEELCSSLYSYFNKSPKRFLAYLNVADKLGTTGNRVLRNVKTRWMSLLDPAIRVLDEYQTLVGNMSTCDSGLAKKNLRLLRDFETLLSLSLFIPLLECVNHIQKFAQLRDSYICDFVNSINHCKGELFRHFVDSDTAFTDTRVFHNFKAIIENRSLAMDFIWLPDMNTSKEFLNYNVLDANHNCYRISEEGEDVFISKIEFNFTIIAVQAQVTSAAKLLIQQLDEKFPDVDVINALGVVFPQYWQNPCALELFPLHMEAICKFYCAEKAVADPDGEDRENADPRLISLLNRRDLDNEVSLFKSTMLSFSAQVMASEDIANENPLCVLWHKVAASTYLAGSLQNFCKLAKIAVVTAFTSVEDERTFSTLAWMKSKVRNRLDAHLDCTLRLYSQPWYTVPTFPYRLAVDHWESIIDRRGVN
jgi:hypothetical protein